MASLVRTPGIGSQLSKDAKHPLLTDNEREKIFKEHQSVRRSNLLAEKKRVGLEDRLQRIGCMKLIEELVLTYRTDLAASVGHALNLKPSTKEHDPAVFELPDRLMKKGMITDAQNQLLTKCATIAYGPSNE